MPHLTYPCLGLLHIFPPNSVWAVCYGAPFQFRFDSRPLVSSAVGSLRPNMVPSAERVRLKLILCSKMSYQAGRTAGYPAVRFDSRRSMLLSGRDPHALHVLCV
ncbi:hypothetical protein C8R44DRAFT_991848, partial [Mycena epipterygia]